MKKLLVLLFSFFLLSSTSVFGNYNSWKQNPDGTYVLGSCYNSWKQNPDGTYVLGGMYNSWKQNPDGTYVVRGDFVTCRK